MTDAGGGQGGVERLEREARETQAVFEALAHPTRRHILLVIRFRNGAMTAGEIAGRFSCSWPTVSNHLRALQEAGLVEVERNGKERLYTLRSDRLLGATGSWLRWFEDAKET